MSKVLIKTCDDIGAGFEALPNSAIATISLRVMFFTSFVLPATLNFNILPQNTDLKSVLSASV